MNFKSIILCLSIGMLSCGTVGNTFAKVLDKEEAKKLVNVMKAKKLTMLEIEARDDYDEIVEAAFEGNSSIEKIKIPTTVKKIGKMAFANLRKLKTVEIESGVKEIGELAFSGNTKMSTINIPESVENIGQEAFKGNKELKNVSIPGSVNKIGFGAFAECTSLNNVTFENAQGKLEALNQTFKNCSNLRTVNLPDGLKMICSHTFFKCNALESIELPKSLRVHSNAFYSCRNLQNITLYASTKIERGAFLLCNNVKKIRIVGDEKYEKKEKALDFFRSSMLQGNEKDDDFLIYTGFKKIKNEKQKNRYRARQQEIFDNIKNMIECIDDNSKSVDDAATLTANRLGEIIKSSPNSQEIVIPEGYTSINSNAFAGRNITSVTIPNSMTVIGKEAFNGCSSLKRVVVHQKLKEIHPKAFSGCQGVCFEVMYSQPLLTPDELNTVEAIFKKPFEGFWKRDWVPYDKVVENKVEQSNVSIDDDTTLTANRVCEIIKSSPNPQEIVIPEGYTSINSNAFSGRNITSVTIPNSMTVIGKEAFNGCSSLKRVVVHQKLKEIHPKAFSGCKGVYFVVMHGHPITSTEIDTIEAIFNKHFEGFWKRNWKPYEYDGVLTATLADDLITCSLNPQDVIIPEGYTSINSNAFAGQNVTSVTIPNSMTVIGENAFTGCTSLKRVVVHQKLKEINPRVCRLLRCMKIRDTLQVLA